MSEGRSRFAVHSPTLKSALSLLRYRSRSQKELTERLKLKKFSDHDIATTLSYLKDIKLLDDQQFAKEWMSSRIRKHVSIKLIKKELEQKGINQKIINDQCQHLDQKSSEIESLKQLIAKKKNFYKDLDPATRQRRLYGYLARKGFHSDDIVTVLNSC